jgi:nitric-oxide synthase
LSKGTNRKVIHYKLKNRIQLHDGDKDGRTTILIELEAHDKNNASFYMPGDHLGIYPENRKEIVNGLLKHFSDQNVDQEYEIYVKINRIDDEKNDSEDKWVLHERLRVTSLREALTRYLDITTPPTQQLLSLFALNATNENDKRRLQTLANDSTKYEEWKAFQYPNLMEVLSEFQSVKPSFELLLTQLPALQSRFYSISSSPLMFSSSRIDLTIAVVKYTTQSGEKHFGVCSNYLNQIESGHSVYGFIRSAPNFRLPDDKSLPLILVGPGSGIAPFRAFWQHRAALTRRNKVEREKFGKMTLFFGCRTPLMQLHTKEIQEMVNQAIITQNFTAFSRVEGQSKVSFNFIYSINFFATYFRSYFSAMFRIA